jgi:protein DGCR14
MAPPSWTPQRSETADNLTPTDCRLLEHSTMGTAAARQAESMARTSGWETKGKERDLDRVRWTLTPSSLPRG